ncbi:MAG: M14 family zinc carboxypeptidase, partial [Actinomycetota bacterium]
MSARTLAGYASAAVLLLAALGGPIASAAPVACDGPPGVPATPTGRVFPEPMDSVTFVSFQEFQCGMDTLEEAHPDLIEQMTVGTSKNGHPIFDILLTDETVGGEKRKLLVVNSIHGNEPGGREGAFRVIEDMVDPDLLGREPWVDQVLDQFVIHFLFVNPDGWVNGDISGDARNNVTATRGNGTGRDLNRQFPVQGYIYTPNATLAEPEGSGVIENMFGGERGEDWYLGTDNHGQGPDTYAAAGLQIVGQFDYQKSETLARFADDIDDAMAQYGVLSDLQTLKEETGEDIGPYHWGTLYDMLGYSASGSMIDWYNTPGIVDGTGFATELTVGSEVSGAAYPQALAQVWVDSIRAINYTMFRHAIDPKTFTYDLGGRTAYVFDPEVIRHDDANGSGYVRQPGEDIPQRPYEVSRMRFFEDLSDDASQELTKVRVRHLLKPKGHRKRVRLRRFDSLILA